MAQNGKYIYWQQDREFYKLYPTAEQANQALRAAVQEVIGNEPLPAGQVISDEGSLIYKGILTAVLGTYDQRMKEGGFHRPTDNLGRVVMDRLPEGVEMLACLLHRYDQQ